MIQFREPIDEKRRDELLDAIAKKIKQYGLAVPAIFFLEMNKPFSYIGGQAMHFFAPVVGVFFETFEDYAYFFDDRQNVELLIQRIEAIAMEEEEEKRQRKALKETSRKRKAEASMLDDALKMEPDGKAPDNGGN
ncbi:MAG TPA: hypothetical protein GX529_07390 [Firmicutes bacterium]|nr:hypothetical protein [Candidatus Fermentithermobacillaceae bacterium]